MKNNLKYIIFAGIFLAPFIPFLVSSSLFFPFVTTKAFAWRFIVEIVFASWLLLAIREPEYRPKKSWLLYVVVIFLVVVGLADIFGVNPSLSFWSNFERMEGFVSLLHLGAYFLVVSSVMNEELWAKWWKTSLAASVIMGVIATFQILGWVNISRGDVRVDGTFGNAIYLAVYMLFHIFIALFYLVREWGNRNMRWVYAGLIAFQLFILYHTATRGAILGLLGGAVILALLNLRASRGVLAKKASLWALVGVLAIVGAVYLARGTEFVSQSPVLSRFSSLSLGELRGQGRYFVWPMAWEGFLEHPVLGWGQEGFFYVFQKHYVPEMHQLEPWFDRAHNIFLDWLVSAGVLGLGAYLALYGFAFYLIWRKADSFSLADKSILTALLSAYFFHNFFVFDHLVSYVLFFSFLAYIAGRSGGERLWQRDITEKVYQSIVTPVVIVGLVAVVYFINLAPMKANLSLIQGMKSSENSGELSKTLGYFESAHQSSYLGRSELLERVVENATSILSNQDLTTEEKNNFYAFVERIIAEDRDDLVSSSRYHLVSGSFLASFGALDQALAHLELAQELSPGKQVIRFELGSLYINKKEPLKALAIFKQAYEMAPEYKEAQIIYLIGAIYAGDRAVEREMLGLLSEAGWLFDDRIVSAYYLNGRIDRVRAILERRKILDPANASTYNAYLKQL